MNRFLILKNRLFQSALFKDSFWALSGNVFGKGLALLASIFIARLLGKDIFGMYGLIRTTLLGIAVFSTFGLGYTATKFVAEYVKSSPDKVRSVVRNIMQITFITGFLFAFFLFLFSKQIAQYLDAGHLYRSIQYLSVIVIFNSITTTQIGVLAGFKRFKATARINFINGLITFVLSVLLTYYFSLDGALFALLVSQIINCIQNNIEVNRCLSIFPIRKSVSVKNILIKFSFPIALQEMLYSIFQWTMPVLLVKYSNYGEVGIYNAATQWSSVILFIPGALRNVIFAHFSSHSGNQLKQKQLLYRMLLFNFIATFIPFCVVWLFSGLIVSAYGESFQGLQSVLNISVFTTIFTCMSSVYLHYLISLNKVWITFFVKLSSVIFTIILFIYITSYYGNGKTALHLAMSNAILSCFFVLLFHVIFKVSENNKL